MRNNRSQIHPSALGGFTIDGPYYRRSAVRDFFRAVFNWITVA